MTEAVAAGRLRAMARARPAATHFLLSMAISAGVVAARLAAAALEPRLLNASRDMVAGLMEAGAYPNVPTIAFAASSEPILFLIFVFAGAPTIAAVILSAAGVGMSWRDLCARLHLIGPDRAARPLAIYLWLALAYVLGCLLYQWLAGRPLSDPGRFGWFGAPLIGIALAPFIDEGGLLEEIGWRGFALPLLLAYFRRWYMAAAVLGGLHWAWHLPREAVTIAAGIDPVTFFHGQAVFLVLCIALSVLASAAVIRSGGSVWPAVFVHGGTNAWAKALGDGAPMIAPMVDVRTAIVVVGAAALVAYSWLADRGPPRD